MTASTEYFQPPHATRQHQDVKLFFANQVNMRKNPIREYRPPNKIVTFFQKLMGVELMSMRLSTSLTNSKPNGVLSPYCLSVVFEDEERKVKFRALGKNLETASVIRLLKRNNSADGTRQENSCTRGERGEGIALASRTAWAFSCRTSNFTTCSLSRAGADPRSTSCTRNLAATRCRREYRSYRRHK